ncbi:hypothetical protein [Daejeonella sp.]|uniref:hypothetical protein n=1 Tax=Daejeonella sp. TaxID=2805397 RepID=UPI0025C382A2|nr:hypothetical protein [Daejeonella sp.]
MNEIIRILELKRFTFEDLQKLLRLQTEKDKVKISAFQLMFSGNEEFRKLSESQDEVFHKYNINQEIEKTKFRLLFKEIETFNSDEYENALNIIKEKSGENKLEEEELLRLEQIEIQKKNEALRIEKLKQNQLSILLTLDKNSDGNVDIIENDFNKLFSKNQKRVMDIDKNYIHQFVKVSNFIKTKKENTQKIFESIRDTSTQEELEERVNLLKNQIHSYELLVFHSINMIGALISEDLITFYEIYESFDKLGMFNSNWENEVSEKLTNIGDKLDDLMESIYNMEQNIVSELSHLSYVTQASFEDLNISVTNQLREVESSINTNNLLTGIQAYQLYKINKNTKGIR